VSGKPGSAVGVAPGVDGVAVVPGGDAVGVALAVGTGEVGVALAVGTGEVGVGVAPGGGGVAVAPGGGAVGVALGAGAIVVAVGVVPAAQLELETVLVSIVTAPFRAKALPDTLAPVVRVMLVSARIFPTNVLFVPRTAELPICQNTLQG